MHFGRIVDYGKKYENRRNDKRGANLENIINFAEIKIISIFEKNSTHPLFQFKNDQTNQIRNLFCNNQ